MKNNFTRKKNTHFFLFLLWNIYIIPTATDPRRWNNNFMKKINDILKYLMEEKTSTFQCSLSGVVFGTNNFFLFDTYLPQTYFDKLNDHWNIYYILLTKEKQDDFTIVTLLHLPLRLLHAQRQQCNIQWAKNGKNSAIKNHKLQFEKRAIKLVTFCTFFLISLFRALCATQQRKSCVIYLG